MRYFLCHDCFWPRRFEIIYGWDIERWEIGGIGQQASRLIQIPFRKSGDRFMSVRHWWQGYTHCRCVHQPEAVDRRKQTIWNSADWRNFNSEDSTVSHGLRSSRQHRSIFSNGSWRQTLSRYCNCPITPELLYDFTTLYSRAAASTQQQFRFFHLQPRRGCCLIERRYNRSQFKRVKFQRN